MLTLDDFDYELPDASQIAQHPLENRTESRLLCYQRDENTVQHRQFKDITEFLKPGDLLVFNNTRVIPARLFGYKQTGGRVEILIERIIPGTQCILAHLKTSKVLRPGAKIWIEPHDYLLTMVSREGDLWMLEVHHVSMDVLLKECGHMPLPPYIRREDVLEDATRYQTVFAKCDGAVAAPTASLHFDTTLLKELEEKGIHHAFLTLHVGAGTFQPVRVRNLDEHVMHKEYLEVDLALCEKINATKAAGHRVIAVGTTVVRALETAASSGSIMPYQGETQIFITPGYTFRVIDGLLTNFHWPKSTLLMLVSALIAREKLLSLYEEAKSEHYRFFSYGDAMLII